MFWFSDLRLSLFSFFLSSGFMPFDFGIALPDFRFSFCSHISLFLSFLSRFFTSSDSRTILFIFSYFSFCFQISQIAPIQLSKSLTFFRVYHFFCSQISLLMLTGFLVLFPYHLFLSSDFSLVVLISFGSNILQLFFVCSKIYLNKLSCSVFRCLKFL